ncbi:MAG TPA: hypothetical protein VJB57_20845, partial [Dehalococcoidia bacterium]|nr:hypothetical protein [Dehalococcoidia bacterium]
MVVRLLGAGLLSAVALFASGRFDVATAGDTTLAVLKCEVSDTNPRTGGKVEIACSLIDNLGQPVTNTDLTFFINFEARTDATYDNGRKTAIKS